MHDLCCWRTLHDKPWFVAGERMSSRAAFHGKCSGARGPRMHLMKPSTMPCPCNAITAPPVAWPLNVSMLLMGLGIRALFTRTCSTGVVVPTLAARQTTGSRPASAPLGASICHQALIWTGSGIVQQGCLFVQTNGSPVPAQRDRPFVHRIGAGMTHRARRVCPDKGPSISAQPYGGTTKGPTAAIKGRLVSYPSVLTHSPFSAVVGYELRRVGTIQGPTGAPRGRELRPRPPRPRQHIERSREQGWTY
ncbi:hypothetical protein LXA43DRAFT_31175 [Ganoderma leucocontextum]|nr:hypothetical protein LXA43DRAFT_31175 [Ganoderma leucocontextum]